MKKLPSLRIFTCTLPGIKSINSTSQEGANFILLEFDWAMDMDDVQLDVMQRIEVIPIPDGASKPDI